VWLVSSLRCRRALVAITALGVLSIEMVATSSRLATAAPAPWVAYVLTSGAGGGGSSFPVSTGTNIPGNPIASPSNTAPQAIAITPDGSTAYVTDHYEFEQAIRTADNAAVSINAGIAPSGVAVTPDGTTAWVADSYDSQLIPISTATNHGGAPIPVAGSPSRLAITPDGSTAYAVNGSDITPASLANGHVGATVPVFSAGSSPVGIVITPSGSQLYDAGNVTPSSGFVAVIAPGATPALTKSIGPFGALGGIAMRSLRGDWRLQRSGESEARAEGPHPP
jgi:YVTN family beta-propeller protein